MLKKRTHREDDQQNIEKAFEILNYIVESHPEIERTLWYGAFQSAFAQGHINSGFSYDLYCEIMDDIKLNYKGWFEE